MGNFCIGNLLKLLINNSALEHEEFAKVIFDGPYTYENRKGETDYRLDKSDVSKIISRTIGISKPAYKNFEELTSAEWIAIGNDVFDCIKPNNYNDTGRQIQELVMNDEEIYLETIIGFNSRYTKNYIGSMNGFSDQSTLSELIASALRYTILYVDNKHKSGKKDDKTCAKKNKNTQSDHIEAASKSGDASELLRKKIADAYYNVYKPVEIKSVSNKIENSLIKVFYYPSFVGGELLDLSEDGDIFICAPNGFGKSTLLRALLCATNPSSEIREQQELSKRVEELKNHYKIGKEYLTLFIDLKKVNDQNPFKNDNDLGRWLLFASKLEKVLKLDEFRKLVTYYNQINQLILIFDSVDEIIPQTVGGDIDKDGVFAQIRLLTCADEICSNAKVIVASRPLAFSEDDMLFRYLHIDSLLSQKENVETIIARYSPNYKDELMEYIYGDLYLKYLVTTPALLLSVIGHILSEKYNEETGRKNDANGRYGLIKTMIQHNMRRFKYKGNEQYQYKDKTYEDIYEIFAYASLFNYIENRKEDLVNFQNMILKYELKDFSRHRKPIEKNDIIDAYEHFCLLNTQDNYLEFLAPEVMRPYYLAKYMCKLCILAVKDEPYNPMNVRNRLESIWSNKLGSETCIHDMLVFFFGITYDDTEDAADIVLYKEQMRSIWIDYIVDKWEKLKDDDSVKKIFRSRLQYLLESDFVINSCFGRILNDEDALSENEMRLKGILVEIQKDEL